MSKLSPSTDRNDCGNCAWLDVPEKLITVSGCVNKRAEYQMFECKVPFEVPKIPLCIRVEWEANRRYMCAKYGQGCPTHEPRIKR